MSDRTKLVVIDECILGYIDPALPNSAGILHASVLKGASCPQFGSIDVQYKKVRLATAKDFDDYRVSFEGFNDSKNYEFEA